MSVLGALIDYDEMNFYVKLSLISFSFFFVLLFFQMSRILVRGRGQHASYFLVGQNFTDKDKCSAAGFISYPDGYYFIFF